METENIYCEMSSVQKELYTEVDYLMSLKEEQQRRLKAQLCNHPCLLFLRIKQLSSGFDRMTGKKATREWVNYARVLSRFPTGYEQNACSIEESGKLHKLIEILLEAAIGDVEQEPAQLIVASSFAKVLGMLEDVLGHVNAKLNYSVYRINPNMPSTTRHEDLARAIGDEGRKLVLLDVRTEHLPSKLFDGLRLIFYDYDELNDGKLLARWDIAGVRSVQRLVTLGTFEADE